VTWDPASSPAQLFEAARELDRPQVAQLCGQLIAYVHAVGSAYPTLQAADILQALRRKRHFRLLQQVADAFIQTGVDQPVLRRQYGQSLLDQGTLTAAIGVLEPLAAATVGSDPREHREAVGLLGRAYKQLYVATGAAAGERRRTFLERAVRAYHEVYVDSGNLWHGINVVALLARAHRDATPVEGFPRPGDDAEALATRILHTVEEAGDAATAWDRATAMEACVALGRPEQALAWLDSYLHTVDADAFELASTLRQLTEVWGLSADRDPGARLLPVLQAELLLRQGGEIEVSAADIEPAALDRIGKGTGFEKIFGSERFNSLAWFRDALDRCRAVARIEDPYLGGVGTGFLVRGERLHASLPDVVLVTNAHVLGDETHADGKDPLALDARQAVVTFRALDRAAATTCRIARIEWTSLRHQLDATIATLDSAPGDVTACPVAAGRPLLDADPPPQTYIIGHPRGGEQPMLSIRDNLLLDADDTRIHYRTPTLEGSSGSPVFNTRWELIALHHAGNTSMPRLHGATGTYAANEGIWIDRIAAQLRAERA
jgi:hypothetical protein